jgi:hypothetical protein
MCHEDFDVKMLPTRLICLGDDKNEDYKLVLSEKLVASGELPRYTTLSHKWGLTEFITLYSGNYDALSDGISSLILPRTFKDAAHISRALGVRFMWIDSLCILQDSITDWQKESSMMGNIYRNGILNIAASDGDGPYHGLDLGRVNDTEAIRGLKIQVSFEGSQKTYYCVDDNKHSWQQLVNHGGCKPASLGISGTNIESSNNSLLEPKILGMPGVKKL